MKVLLLIDGMAIGGAETHVLTLASALKKKGIDVSLMCAGGAFVKALAELNIRVYHAPFKERSLRSILASIRALRALKNEHFTVIHAHTRYTAALASLCLPNIPLVTTVHLDFSITPLKRTLCCWGRHALAVSEDLKDYLVREYRVCENRVSLTVNGIDPLAFPPLSHLGNDILHVSRLDKDRSLCALLLCEIAPRLHRYDPNIKIRIYGGGNDEQRVKAAAQKANEKAGTTVVTLFGACDCISKEMEGASMLIGVSRSALEGACSALPIILSGNDGYSGILTSKTYEIEKHDNFCCRNKQKSNADTLFYDIIYLWKHKSFCECIRWKAAALVRKEYTPQRMAEDAISAYYGALRIGAVGYYGYGNFGDEMMLQAMRAQLRQKGIQSFYPLMKDGKSKLSRAHPIRTAFNLRKCDYVLFGGGNLFQNETSMRSLLYYSTLLHLCKKHARIGACMGIGALNGRFASRICRQALRGISENYLRTEADNETAKRLAPSFSEHIHTACDLCFFLPERECQKRGKNKILVIPSAQHSDALLLFLKKMQATGAEIELAILFPQMDQTSAEGIARALKLPPPKAIRNTDDFFESICDARLCISMRLHGAIFSLLYHTPCMLFGHSEKNRAFIKDVKLAAAACHSPAPIYSFLCAEEAEEKEKEAAAKNYGFSEIISFFRKRLNY